MTPDPHSPCAARAARSTTLIALLSLTAAPLMTSCNQDVQAADKTEAARELQKAREAFSNYAELEADAFREKFENLMTATDRRIDELKKQVAESDAKEQAEKALAELEDQRQALQKELADLGDATGDAWETARDRIGAKVSDWQDRLQAAWRELVK